MEWIVIHASAYFLPLDLHPYDPQLVQLFVGSDENIDANEEVDTDEDDGDDDMIVDEAVAPVPQARNKRGSKKKRQQESQPLSPTRPPTKRDAPTSPPSPTTRPKPRVKKSKGSTQPKASAAVGKSNRKVGKGKAANTTQPTTPVQPALSTTSSVSVTTTLVPSSGPVSGPMSAATSSGFSGAPIRASSAPQTVFVNLNSSNSLTDLLPRRTEDVFMQDVNMMSNPATDPLLRAMENDPTYQMDPEELDALAQMGLQSPPRQTGELEPAVDSPLTSPVDRQSPPTQLTSSPLTSPPPTQVPAAGWSQSSPLTSPPRSPIGPPGTQTFASGIKTRAPPAPTVAGPSSHSHPQPESISGVKLIPGGRGQFKAGARQQPNKRKSRRG